MSTMYKPTADDIARAEALQSDYVQRSNKYPLDSRESQALYAASVEFKGWLWVVRKDGEARRPLKKVIQDAEEILVRRGVADTVKRAG